MPSCLLWDVALQAYNSESCSAVNWTASNTTCECGSGATEVVGASGASFTSGSAALLNYIGSTFDVKLNGAFFLQNLLLIYTFGTILVLTIINAILGCAYDRRDSSRQWTTVEAAKARRLLGHQKQLGELRAEAGVAESEQIQAAIAAERTPAEYARKSLPDFVNETSLCDTFTRVLRIEHSWIQVRAFSTVVPLVSPPNIYGRPCYVAASGVRLTRRTRRFR